jgi:O-antigen/teichoic acid export membrane protein
MNQLATTVLRNSIVGMAAHISMKLLSFAFSVLIIRNLGATDFGQYAPCSVLAASSCSSPILG